MPNSGQADGNSHSAIGRSRVNGPHLLHIYSYVGIDQLPPAETHPVPKQVRQEIEKFFVATDELEDKQLKFLGWKSPKTGERLIDNAAKVFKKLNDKS